MRCQIAMIKCDDSYQYAQIHCEEVFAILFESKGKLMIEGKSFGLNREIQLVSFIIKVNTLITRSCLILSSTIARIWQMLCWMWYDKYRHDTTEIRLQVDVVSTTLTMITLRFNTLAPSGINAFDAIDWFRLFCWIAAQYINSVYRRIPWLSNNVRCYMGRGYKWVLFD